MPTGTELRGWREDYDWAKAFEVCGPPASSAASYGSSADNEPDVGGTPGFLRDIEVPGYTGPGLSTFQRPDVTGVVGMAEGENDGATWMGLFQLRDGRFAYVEAGCDYTGWD